jgi:hypothetical protein
MLNTKDQENLTKATHDVNFLVQDLSILVNSTNPLLADIATEILQQAAQIEKRLLHIEFITKNEEKIS